MNHQKSLGIIDLQSLMDLKINNWINNIKIYWYHKSCELMNNNKSVSDRNKEK